MITCKLCGTELGPRMKRKDGSMLCPECGQIYWKSAVDAALSSQAHISPAEEREIRTKAYWRESRRSAEMIRARLA